MPLIPRLAGLYLLAASLSGCAFGSVDLSGLTTGSTDSYAENDRSPSRLPGRVYILRGMGHIWSGGMTELADKLNRRGVLASSHKHNEWRELADEAIKLHKSDPDRWPIILIGHSNGGDNIIQMAEKLNEAGVPVALAVGFDPTRFARPVPTNVRRFINLYQATNIMGGGEIHASTKFRGQLINVDLRKHPEIGHMNMDKSRRLQEEVLAKVLQVAAFPMPAPASMVSIKYVVPAKATIELWDGGMPVTLERGQTIESLANFYGVPAWAIMQANDIPEYDAPPLKPGRRLVIPQHLNTLASTTASAAPPVLAPASEPRAAEPTLAEPRRGERRFGEPMIGQPRLGAIGQ